MTSAQACREVLRRQDLLLNQQLFELRLATLVIAPRGVVERLRVFPLADRANQLLPEIFPVELPALGKGQGQHQTPAVPMLG
jgi:hypothetical protein